MLSFNYISLSDWFVFIETFRQYLKNLGGINGKIRFPNSFRLMVEVFVKLSNHEVLFNYAVSEYT